MVGEIQDGRIWPDWGPKVFLFFYLVDFMFKV